MDHVLSLEISPQTEVAESTCAKASLLFLELYLFNKKRQTKNIYALKNETSIKVKTSDQAHFKVRVMQISSGK